MMPPATAQTPAATATPPREIVAPNSEATPTTVNATSTPPPYPAAAPVNIFENFEEVLSTNDFPSYFMVSMVFLT